VPPIPLLLDTFTAADGTDPTSRSPDAVGSVWTGEQWVAQPAQSAALSGGGTFWFRQLPVIRSGRMCSPEYFLPSSQRYYPNAGLVLQAPEDLVFGWPATLVVDAMVSGDALGRWISGLCYGPIFENIGVYFEALPEGVMCTATVDDYIASSAYFGNHLVASGVDHKAAVHVTSTDAYLIIDGAVVETISVSIPQLPLNQVNALFGIRDVSTPLVAPSQSDEGISSIGLYQNLTLEQAIALTA